MYLRMALALALASVLLFLFIFFAFGILECAASAAKINANAEWLIEVKSWEFFLFFLARGKLAWSAVAGCLKF